MPGAPARAARRPGLWTRILEWPKRTRPGCWRLAFVSGRGMPFTILEKLRPWSRARRSAATAFPSLEELAARKRSHTGQAGTVVAFYTKNSLYEQEKDRLLKSARYLGLDVDAVGVESAGSWVRNAGLKPGVLVERRKALRGPLLYVDVDAVFHRDPWPELLPIGSDIATYYEANGRLLSGTILINDTPAALALLEAWREGCLAAPETWDQLVLENIVTQDSANPSPRYSVSRLPVSFCWIYGRVKNELVDHIYIEHLQASRETNKRQRRFGRSGKLLKRRRDRVAEIERILNG